MPACCPANVRETKIAFGFKKQVDLVTKNLVADLWSLTKTNPTLSVVTPVNENDAQDIGKGDEFPATLYPSHVDTAVPLEKFVSSEFLAWLFCFTTGNFTKTAQGTTGFKYTATPSDPAVTCLALPAFTWAEQIRVPPESVIDRALVGMVVNTWTLTMESGPGRNNCRVTAGFVGTGSVTQPSTYTPWPTVTAEHFLNAASATISINGIDYVLAQSFISLEFSWNNNVRLDTGYYPGSGTQNTYAIRGRMEHGDRECSLKFVARACKGSQEYTNLLARTEAATIITLKGALIESTFFHDMTITMPRTVISAVVNGEADGLVTVECEVTILKGAGAYVTMAATTTKDAVGSLLDEFATATFEQPNGVNVPATQGTGSVNVITTTADPWTAVSDSPWLAVQSPLTPTVGNAAVTYAYGLNPGPERIGHITMAAGEVYTVTQAGV
jgi:hypothetical protein